MSVINIGLISDDNYVAQTATLIASILSNSLASDDLSFYLIDVGIQSENIDKINQLQNIKNFQLHLLSPNVSRYSTFNSHDWPICVCYRFDFPDLLPQIDRLLYLDSDMVVCRSLHELWNYDLENKSIGACPDPTELPGTRHYGPERLGIQNVYFNSGMLLLDLKKIRENHLFDKTLQWLHDNPEKILFIDQDSLNVVFQNDKKILPRIWNCSPNHYLNYFRDYYKNEPDFAESVDNPAIIHYAGKNMRPWDYMYCEKWGSIFWKYLKMTPWKTSFKPRNITFLNVVLYRPCKSLYMSFFYFQDSIRNKVVPAIEKNSYVGNVMIKSIKSVLRLFRKLVRKH